MSITIQSTAQLVSGYAAAVQAAATSVINFVTGSIELARANAVAGVTMWLQSLITQVLALTRAATSVGSDLDSWLADFGITTRTAAVAATGTVTFSRNTSTTLVYIAPGVTVQTSDGSQQFTVIADATQSAWNSSLNEYEVAIGTSSVNVTVQAVTAGIGGNVNANTITQIASAVDMDTVTNAAAFSTGVDEQSDADALTAFQLALQGLRSGILSSVDAAINAAQLGIQYNIVENETFAGATQDGFFYVVISPYNTTLQSAVYSAVDAVRPLSVTFAVYQANTTSVTIIVTVTAATNYTHATVAANVQTAIENFISALALGDGLVWSELYSVIWTVAGVATASALTVNSATNDIAGVANTAITVGSVTVN